MKLQNIIFSILIIFISFSQIYNLENKKEKSLSYEELMDLTNSPEFQSLIEEQEIEDINLKMSLFGGDECLVSEKEAKQILSEKYGITEDSPDENMRFILGKCNPVLMVPGIYGTKLVVELNCKGIATDERKTTLKNIRVYCGDTVCKDETKTSEEHPLLVALLDQAVSILGSNYDKYSSCLGFLANYFQNEEECPKDDNNNNICYYSKYIKVGFYGGTTETVSKGRCGVEGIQNIIQSGISAVDNIVNIGVAKSYGQMSSELIKRGYKEGFSIGGLPNDYRRYATNNFATKVFQSQINRLYSNTGKPVVIIGHSYGSLVTLTNLLKEENKNVLNKIKKFIAIAPPFSGSSNLLDAFFHGLNDWNKSFNVLGQTITISNYNIFGQLLMYKTLPTLIELRPLSFATKLFTDSAYSELSDAILERIELEKECKNKDCSYEYILLNSKKFDNIFKGYFPSLSDDECEYEENIGGNEKTFNRKCYTNIYNIAECPTIITKPSNSNNIPSQEVFEKDFYCNKFGSNYFYQTECDNEYKNCLDEMLSSDKCPNVFSNGEAVSYLVDRFNEEFSSEFGGITKKYFDSYSRIQQGVKNSISYHNEIDIIKELPIPPIDTDIVYGAFTPTTAALVFDENDFSKEGELYKGGDGKVPTWSSLLTGLKWIYEKKKNNLSQNIRLIEYCSRLSVIGQYKYDANKDQTFASIGCGCLNSNNVYKDSIGGCSHASMIGDEDLIKYIISIVDDPKEIVDYTDAKKVAINAYKSSIDYENICNKDLYNILDTAK